MVERITLSNTIVAVLALVIAIIAFGIAIAVREGHVVNKSIKSDKLDPGDDYIFNSITVNDNTTLGSNTNDTITVKSELLGDIIPKHNSSYDLGSNSKKWSKIYADEFVGASVTAGVTSVKNTTGGLSISPMAGDVIINVKQGEGICVSTDGVSAHLSANSGLIFGTDHGISVHLGKGLYFDNGVSVRLGTGLTFDSDGGLSVTTVAGGGGAVTSVTPSNSGISVAPTTGGVTVGLSIVPLKGLSIGTSDGLSVLLGSGLDFDSSGGISVQLGKGLYFDNGVSVRLGTGLTFDSDGGLSVTTVAGGGGGVTSVISLNPGISVAPTTGGVTVGLSIVPLKGLSIGTSDGLSVLLGSGLDFDSSGGISVQLGKGLYFDNGVSVRLGTGLTFDSDGGLSVTTVAGGGGAVTSVTPSNSGISVAPTTGGVTVGLSIVPLKGLSIGTSDGLSVLLGSGLDFDSSGGISVQLGKGLYFDNGVSVRLGTGLTFDSDGGLSVTTVAGGGGGVTSVISLNPGISVAPTTGGVTVGLSIVPLKGLSIGTSDGLSVLLGSGLDFDSSGGISVQLGKGLYFDNGVSVRLGTGLTFDSDGGLSVTTVAGGGGAVTSVTPSNSGISIGGTDTAVTVGLSIAPLMGLSITSDGLSVLLGSGLDFDSSGGINVQLGYGLEFTGSSIGVSNVLAENNTSYATGPNCGVFGGNTNEVRYTATNSVIIGGKDHTIHSSNCGILGGDDITVNAGAAAAIGGTDNKVDGPNSVTVGGKDHIISSLANQSVLVGGTDNYIRTTDGAIVGGTGNIIYTGDQSVIVGGKDNYMIASNSVIIGGEGLSTWSGTSFQYSTLVGTYNDEGLSELATSGNNNPESFRFMVGGGTTTNRTNIFTVDNKGNLYFGTSAGSSIFVRKPDDSFEVFSSSSGGGGVTSVIAANTGISVAPTTGGVTVGLSIVPLKGLSIGTSDGLSVLLGSGLDFDSSGGISVQLNKGLYFDNGVSVRLSTGLTFGSDGGISVTTVAGGGGAVTSVTPSNSGISVAPTTGGVTVGLSIVPLKGLSIGTSDGLSVLLGSGLDFDSSGGISVQLGKGLYFDNGVSVRLGTGLTFDSDGGLSVTTVAGGGGAVTSVTPSNSGISVAPTTGGVTVGLSIVPLKGLSIGTSDGLSVLLGSGLDFDSSGGISVQLGKGLYFDNGVSVRLGTGLTFDSDGGLSVTTVAGGGGGVTSVISLNPGISVAPTTGGVTVGLSIVPLKGLSIGTSDGLSVLLGSGLDFDSSGGISVQLGKGLYFDNGVSVRLGTGLTFDSDGGLSVTTVAGGGGAVTSVTPSNSGISIGGTDTAVTVGLSIAPLMGLSITSDGLSVLLGSGLDFDSSGGINVQLGYGLEFTGSSIGVSNVLAENNTSYATGPNCGVFGGNTNEVRYTATNSVIIGGKDHTIHSSNCGILGGDDITVNAGAAAAIGGTDNKVDGPNSVTVGGKDHIISSLANQSVLVGGTDNYIRTTDGAIVGGTGNIIYTGDQSVIVGGKDNYMIASNSVIIGGEGLSTWSGTSFQYSTLVGTYNDEGLSELATSGNNNPESFRFMVGGGTTTNRTNIFTVDNKGNLYFGTSAGSSIFVRKPDDSFEVFSSSSGGGGVTSVIAANTGISVAPTTGGVTVGLSIVPLKGLSIGTSDGLSVLLGSGLDFDSSGGISVQLNKGLYFDNGVSVRLSTGLTFGSDGGISVITGAGGAVTSVAALNTGISIGGTDTAVTVGLSIAPLMGLSITSDGLSVLLGSGLDFDSSGGINVQLGYGLEFTGSSIGVSNVLAENNTSYATGPNCGVFGGNTNEVRYTATNSVIIGGKDHTIHSSNCGILGGDDITVNAGAAAAIGGTDNKVDGPNSVTVGGKDHIISSLANQSVLVGGTDNYIRTTDGAIVGGTGNIIYTGDQSVIVGGKDNYMIASNSVIIGGEGLSTWSGTSFQYSTLVGTYNDEGLSELATSGNNNPESFRFMVGGGTTTNRTNIFTVDNKGNLYFGTSAGSSIFVRKPDDSFEVFSSSSGGGGVTSVIAANTGISVAPTTGGVTVGLSIVPLKGLSIGTSDGLSVLLGSGLDFDSSGGISVQLSKGLYFDNGVSVRLGTGLTFDSSGGLSVITGAGGAVTSVAALNTGISIGGTDTAVTVGLSIAPLMGLSITSDGLSVLLGSGLDFDSSGGINVQLGYGLEFTGSSIGVSNVLAENNTSYATGPNCGVFGGNTNEVRYTATNSVIIGGKDHTIHSSNCGILGGDDITVNAGAAAAIGGTDNKVDGPNSVTVGGKDHIISSLANQSVLVGGTDNYIRTTDGAIVGGTGNIIYTGDQSVIVGGKDNYMIASNSVIIGGEGLSTWSGTSFQYSTLVGTYNDEGLSELATSGNNNPESFRFMVGGGTTTNRTNIFTVDNKGNLYFGTSAGSSIFVRKPDDSFEVFGGVTSVAALNSGISIGGSDAAVTVGISIAPLKGLSITSDGVSVMLGSGLDFDSSGGVSVQLSTGLVFDNNNAIGLSPVHTRMYLDGPSQIVTFNTGDVIWFNGVSGGDYLGGTSAFFPPVSGYYNSSVHLFNGASATVPSIIALRDEENGIDLQKFKTYGIDDVSFSGIFEMNTGTSYSIKVVEATGYDVVLGKGYSEWSVHYISQ